MDRTAENIPARRYTFRVGPEWAGLRLDRFVAAQEVQGGVSRSEVKRLDRLGLLTVNGAPCKLSHAVRAGDLVELTVPQAAPVGLAAEEIEFPVLYQDDDIVVIDKPAGLVVHPAPGHSSGTLVNGLLHRLPQVAGVGGEGRPGIVHRLDRDTSGVMVAALSEAALRSLAAQFAGRGVEKEYLALLEEIPPGPRGTVDRPIGRHPVNRKKMAVVERGGRRAVTHWRVEEEFACGFCLAGLRIETGRTHQIRVHMASIGAPVAGDAVYGGRRKGMWGELAVGRQMLHAARLVFDHPASGERLSFTAPLPEDMQRVLSRLREEG